jgi:hypothetical protein
MDSLKASPEFPASLCHIPCMKHGVFQFQDTLEHHHRKDHGQIFSSDRTKYSEWLHKSHKPFFLTASHFQVAKIYFKILTSSLSLSYKGFKAFLLKLTRLKRKRALIIMGKIKNITLPINLIT